MVEVASSPAFPAKPRILLIARACVIPGMMEQLAGRADAYFCVEKKRGGVPTGMKRFTLRAAWKLRKALRENQYDLVISCFNPDPIWRVDAGWLRNVIKLTKKVLRQPGALGTALVPWMLGDSTVPLAVYDWDDNTIIARKNWGLLERAACYFKTQTPQDPFAAFLFQDAQSGSLAEIVRRPVYGRWVKKMRPFSVGVTVPENWRDWQTVEKKTDVFFVGNIAYSWVRHEGVRQLEELRAEGFNIDLHVPNAEKGSIPLEEFLRRASEAWLTWSPEGAGWDCMRHYWAPLMGSVPLLNHPDTLRHQPHIEGEHAFYYGVEGDDLKRVIRLALRDKARLRKMAAAGEAFVRRHHTHAVLVDHLIAETLRSAAQGPDF
jgi:hypothetical protein